MTLYGYAYGPYTIFLSISTVGIPLAVSKFVSKYNTLNDYHTSYRTFKMSVMIMFATGILSFLVMFFSADLIAKWTIDEGTKNISIDDVKYVIRMVSFSLIIIPGMAVMRGFFQGNQSMEPTAVSQVIEQIARIVFLLVVVFIIIQLAGGERVTAVGWATFAAFIGGLASWIVLLYYWRSRKRHINENLKRQRKIYQYETKDLLRELISYSGVFVFVGMAIPLFQLVDQFTFNHAMVAIGLADEAEVAYSIFNVQGHKLIILPVTIATGLSLALLPEITSAYNSKDSKRVKLLINQALQIIMFFVLPAVVGIMLLSDEIYGGLFGLQNIDIAGPLLAWYAPSALTLAFFTVTASILQGINEQKFTLISLGIGILTKVLLNSIMIQTFESKGAVISTLIATLIASLLNISRIHKKIPFPVKKLFKLSLLMLIFTAIMTLAVIIVKWIFGLIMDYEEGRIASLFVGVIAALIGGGIYLYLGYASTLFERITGRRIAFVDRLIGRE
ncbi:O-antigen/teichoic acid export membrane protein [Gracilibacillus halotolerans]|uniref:O-antigen/teichoic acid export membrane protein n=2 Tax=Gracilibacillus halotolerans TaxID=74386 RepID=A0A841RMC6_9BACI|nr:O-antigen/teichoic acid export membrane protein [Gracilibacillus halotolerans]